MRYFSVSVLPSSVGEEKKVDDDGALGPDGRFVVEDAEVSEDSVRDSDEGGVGAVEAIEDDEAVGCRRRAAAYVEGPGRWKSDC